MNNCIICGQNRTKYQLVHKELCNKCYRKRVMIFKKDAGKSCSVCSTIDTKKWYGSLCRNCWRKDNDKMDTLEKKIKNRLRSRISKVIAGSVKSGSAVRDLGCSIHYFRSYLESKFQQGMTWENYGEWHIDHVKPLAKFNLSDREEFLEACHYTNLQPLWAIDNCLKRDIYE